MDPRRISAHRWAAWCGKHADELCGIVHFRAAQNGAAVARAATVAVVVVVDVAVAFEVAFDVDPR